MSQANISKISTIFIKKPSHTPTGTLLKRKTKAEKRAIKKARRQKIKDRKKLNFKVTKSTYYRYLKTDRWKKKRAHFFASNPDNRICFICGSKKKLQAHHKTYEHVGEERIADLICLCEDCHRAVHKFLKHNKDVGLWNAADELKTLIESENSLDVFCRFYQVEVLK